MVCEILIPKVGYLKTKNGNSNIQSKFHEFSETSSFGNWFWRSKCAPNLMRLVLLLSPWIALQLILRNLIELPYNFAREKCRKLGANLLSIEDLEILSLTKQQQIQTLNLFLTCFQVDLGLGPKTKFAMHNLNFNFCLRSNFISSPEIIVSSWSKQYHDKP